MKNLRLSFAALAFGAASLAPALAGAQTELRIGMITPPPHVWSQTAMSMAEELPELSDGRLSLQVFPGGQLGNEAAMLQQLQTGALDLAFLTIAEISNRVPDFGAFYAPFLADNMAHAARIIRSDVARDMLEVLPEEVGVVGFGYAAAGMRHLVSRPAINEASDLAGLRIRITPFEPIRDFYNALNVTATPMALPQVYEALANAQVDAIDMDAELIWAMRYFDPAPHVLESNHMLFPMVGLVSGRVWARLSEEDREVITEMMTRNLDAILDTYAERDPEWMAQTAAEAGVIHSVLDADFFADAIAAWEEIWAPRAPLLAELRRVAEETR
ncbi:MAG: TRAP transporter substrate-binding protein [Pararhodobacter sp.]